MEWDMQLFYPTGWAHDGSIYFINLIWPVGPNVLFLYYLLCINLNNHTVGQKQRNIADSNIHMIGAKNLKKKKIFAFVESRTQDFS